MEQIICILIVYVFLNIILKSILLLFGYAPKINKYLNLDNNSNKDDYFYKLIPISFYSDIPEIVARFELRYNCIWFCDRNKKYYKYLILDILLFLFIPIASYYFYDYVYTNVGGYYASDDIQSIYDNYGTLENYYNHLKSLDDNEQNEKKRLKLLLKKLNNEV